ncbi:AI-2E family transporter [Enorma phocaeensis]|uniref:AI-2E family transporter n=1 Tax=Enorma phocaeensis TaxID=1871019 RepID=UPI00320A22B6
MTEGGLSERSSQESKLSGARLLALRVWTVVGAIIIGVAVLNVLGILAPVIEFLAVGSLIAFVESPIVNTLERRGVPRGAGALLGLIVVVAVISCLIMVIGPMIAEQVLEVLARLPNQLRGLGEWVVQLSRDFEALSQSSWASQLDDALTSLADMASGYITQIAGDVGRGVFPFVSAFASQLFIVFLGLVLAYWLALDYPRIHREIGAIVGGEHETSYRFMVAILSRSVGGYMRSMVITSLVNGALAGIALAIAGHPYASLMGVLTGLLHLIPVLGPWISAFAATLLALFYDPILAVWTLIICMVAQNLTDNVISPKVMQSTVQIHPAMSLAALVVGSSLLGALGMVIAIPLCAALKGLFIFYFEKQTGRAIVSYEGAIFKGTPFRDGQNRPVPAFDALGEDSFVTDSELLDDEVAPSGSAVPKPELDNPWGKIAFLHLHGDLKSDRDVASNDDDGR